MPKHVIYTFKELPLYNDKVVSTAQNIPDWAKWNSIKPVGSSSFESYEIDFRINSPTTFPILKFSRVPALTSNELKLEATLGSKKNLHIEWSIQIKQNEECLLLNILLLKGNSSKFFFNQFAPSLTQALKLMNRNFLNYMSKSILDGHSFIDNKYEPKLFLN
jgi:hypothetical protein